MGAGLEVDAAKCIEYFSDFVSSSRTNTLAMGKKNKNKNTITSDTGTTVPASTGQQSQEPQLQSDLPTQADSSSDPSISCIGSAESLTDVSITALSGSKIRTESPSTIMSSMKSVAITSPAAADDLDDSENNIKVNLLTKSDSDIIEARGSSGDPFQSGTSGNPVLSGACGTSGDPGPSEASETSDDPGPCDKKKRDPLSSPESSHDASSLKKRKCLGEESVSCPIGTPNEPAMPEQSLHNVVSNIRYNVSTPDGDYSFYGPRREFTVINLKTSEVLDEPSPINLEALPPAYVILAQQPEDSFLGTEYRSNYPKCEESAYVKHQIRYLYYISEEKNKICASGDNAARLLPENIEIGICRAFGEAVDRIRHNLVCQTRLEEENVFNQEFYCYRNENGYKPPFSTTAMFQQIPASESVIKLATLLLALADAAMNSARIVAGIGYCYVAHRMVTGFRLLSLLEQPYKVLDHFIRQKVGAAAYALELYSMKDREADEKPYDEVCACFTEITSALSTMTADKTTWQAHVLFHDPTLAELSFLDFIEKMIKPQTSWTFDSHLAWTTAIIPAIRTARRVVAILDDIEKHVKTPRVALVSLKKHYATLRKFEMDLNEPDGPHVEALVARFRSMSLSPLLECIQDHKEADEIATQIAEDFTIAVEAERNSKRPNSVFVEQLLEDRMVYTLFRLFYHMWETQKPKHVTMIRLKLLGICKAAVTLASIYGHGGKFPALVALSSIMYLDYTCGMVSKASEISIKKTRERCHQLAENYLSSDEKCKSTCLNLLTIKMEEIQRSIFEEDEKSEEFKFDVCCRILKIATLAFPVLSYFGGIATVDEVSFTEVEKPADESYRSTTRKLRPAQNGQKLLYLSVPDDMIRTYRAAQFLKLGDRADTNTKRMIGAAAAADPDKAVESDSDEDDTEEDVDKLSIDEEQGNEHLFLSNVPPSVQRDVPDYLLTTKPLPRRETIANALEKFTNPSEAVVVMLEPLRSDLPSADYGSVEKSESGTCSSESSGSKSDQLQGMKDLRKMEIFKPIDLKNFYKEISDDKKSHYVKISACESIKLEEVFAKTYIPKSTGEVEDDFLDSLRIVLRCLLVIVNKILASPRGDFDVLRRQHWKKWLERIVLLTNLLKERRLTLQENHRLHQVMYSYCVILGFPVRIFMNPDSC